VDSRPIAGSLETGVDESGFEQMEAFTDVN
jgi:hypothetical protein